MLQSHEPGAANPERLFHQPGPVVGFVTAEDTGRSLTVHNPAACCCLICISSKSPSTARGCWSVVLLQAYLNGATWVEISLS